MALFTIAAALVTTLGISATVATIASAVIVGGLAMAASSLLAPRGRQGGESDRTGNRVQVPPATNNKLPVVYGTAFVGGAITDAKISTDLSTMWFVIALNEVTDTGTITVNEIYYDGKLAAIDTNGNVTSLTSNNNGTPQVDTKINGKLSIYIFPNGGSSGTNTGGLTAQQILSDSTIAANQRWDQGIYTANGQSPTMDKTTFVIVRVKYDQDAGLTSLGQVQAKITNTLTKPGDVILDYLKNDRYGCAIPLAKIDTQSLTDLNTYSDKTITYTPVGGGSATQARFRINGPVDTSRNCLSNLQEIVDACDSWVQYNEISGQWKVVVNKAYDETPNSVTLNSLFLVNDNNLISGISISPTDLNQTFNQIEYQYPNTNIKDQFDFVNIDLADDYPSLLSNNEPVNKTSIRNDLVNNFVQAKYISLRKILQGREDLVVSFNLDYSGMQIEAGDVIRITHSQYGWTNKLFRVSNVTEEKSEDGNLFTRVSGFEYNATIYNDNLNIADYIPAANTGLPSPNNITAPVQPVVVVDNTGTVNRMVITATVPTTGLVTDLDINYGTTSTVANHNYYTTISNGDGTPLTPGGTYTVVVTEVPPASNLRWSVAARNEEVGVVSSATTAVAWSGTGVTTFNTSTGLGGIGTVNIQANAITANLIQANAITAGKIAANAVTATNIAAGSIIAGKIAAGAVTATNINVTTLSAVTATIGTLRTATTGGRTEISDNVIKVFDASNVLRVKIGNLSL